jgi:TPR repeat protein
VWWFRKAANEDHLDAMAFLGRCHEHGLGVPKDPAEGARLYRASADGGNSEAQCRLGECYEVGRGVVKDLNEAISWYEKAARQGMDKAKIGIARCIAELFFAGLRIRSARCDNAADVGGHENLSLA